MTANIVESGRPSTPLGIWLAAVRPQTLTASLTPVLVGSALALANGAFQWPVAVACLLGAALIQIGTNLFNDYADFGRGADTADRLGPPRATQLGWLSARQVLRGTAVSLSLALSVGIYLVWIGGWPILLLGLTSLACAILYTGGPWPLAYVGVADLFVLAFFGVAAVSGTFFLQTGTLTAAALVSGVAVGLLALAILVVNNLRDRETDQTAGKRTLVVRFGRRFGQFEYRTAIVGAFVGVSALVAVQEIGVGALLVWACFPLALICIRKVGAARGRDLNDQLAGTAKLGLVFGILLSLGMLL